MSDVDSWYGRVVDVRSWVFDEGSWRRLTRGDTSRCLMRVAVGWVVEHCWTIIAGSWGRSSCRMQLDDRSGKLRSVVVGKSISPFWQYLGLIGGVPIWLLARTASRTWARCCNAWAVRNSESYVDWMLHCWSVVVEVGVGSLVA